jgi:hypothetical protein
MLKVENRGRSALNKKGLRSIHAYVVRNAESETCRLTGAPFKWFVADSAAGF